MESKENKYTSGNSAPPGLQEGFDYLRERFKALTSSSEKSPTEDFSFTSLAPGDNSENTPLAILQNAFELSPFELGVIVLCAALELDNEISSLCAEFQMDGQLSSPTIGTTCTILPNPHWDAFAPGSVLRHSSLIKIGSDDGFIRKRIQLPERILLFLLSVPTSDAELDKISRPFERRSELPHSQMQITRRLIQHAERSIKNSFYQLYGNDPDGALQVADHIAQDLGKKLLIIDASDLPQKAGEQSNLARLMQREALLSNLIFFVHLDESQDASREEAVIKFLPLLNGFRFLGCREYIAAGEDFGIEINRPTRVEQQSFWAQKFNGNQPRLKELTQQYDFSLERIQTLSDLALSEIKLGVTPETALREACRSQSRPALKGLARRLETGADWEDLILPPERIETLQEIASHTRFRSKVYEEWGFAQKSRRGLGISALFAGPSGTGKTMAAEVLAKELGLDLYQIDLSSVVSKYIGETEKNLRRVFDASEGTGAVLLFDEADALFGKRSDVKDSHDRYANIEVSYLLQRIEAYRGLAILTTNLKSSIDSAFIRRFRFIIKFPVPDETQRIQIWNRIFPEQTPKKNLELRRLSRLSVTGGAIKNIAMNAAFLAAGKDASVSTEDIIKAARSEYRKLERSLSGSEFGRGKRDE